MSVVRILVVDDFEPCRRVVCKAFDSVPKWRVVGEAGDGLEAIQRALDLQPDLITLNIALPRLSGIEAAQEIRKLLPQSRILFLTGNYSLQVAGEALNIGARGYVVKSDAGRQLLDAVEAVIKGHRFVSDRLASLILAEGEALSVQGRASR